MLTNDVANVLGIPNLPTVRKLIVDNLQCDTENERDRQTPSIKDLEVFFLMHPDYGGLSERDTATLLGMSQRTVRTHLSRLQTKISTAVFEFLTNQNCSGTTQAVQQFVPEMENHVVFKF